MFVDIAGWLLSMVNPIIPSDEEINVEDGETPVVITALVNGSNTGLYPLILGPQVMQWFPVIMFCFQCLVGFHMERCHWLRYYRMLALILRDCFVVLSVWFQCGIFFHIVVICSTCILFEADSAHNANVSVES